MIGEEIKLTLFADDMIAYAENVSESIKWFFKLMNSAYSQGRS